MVLSTRRSAIRWLGLVALVMVAGIAPPIAGSSFADEPAGCPPCEGGRPQVLIPIIGGIPNGPEGSPTSKEPPQNHPISQDGTGPSGYITAAVNQRTEQLREEGYDVQVAYFSTMEAFVTWAEALSIGTPPECRCPFTHVEFYAHGNSDGPLANFPSQPLPHLQKPWWVRLGNALRRIMKGGGHVIFGWCWSGTPAGGEYHPAGVTAGKAGAPVYGPGGEMKFPQRDPPYPIGHPFSEPHPEGPTGGPDGWHRFPPEVPGGWDDENNQPDPDSPKVPNGTTEPPVPPEVVNPDELDNDGRGKLPRHGDPMHPLQPPHDPLQPPVPLVGPDGQPLNHPETGQPLVGPDGSPLHGPPPCPDGRPREDPEQPHQPLTQPADGPGFDHHEGRPFGSTPPGGHAPDRPNPTPDNEPYAD